MAEVIEPGAERRSAVERRIVTVLFADLVGFTPLSERLDAEDVAAVQDAYFAAVRETIVRYGGVLEKFIGDAAMAVFGVPRGRDDDAERAVRAGLALVAAVEQLGARLGLEPGELQLRVGVNTGEVVHATEGPDAGRVTGDTVNTAARLQAAAEPDSVLAGELTALSVETSIELDDAEPIALKGKAEPVRARRARSVRANPSRDDAMRGLRAPLLGRQADLDRLEQRGERGRTTIVAPPGVGKSRLLAELERRLADGGIPVLRARARPTSTSPYEVVADLLVAAGAASSFEVALERAGVPPTRQDAIRREVEALLQPQAVREASVAELTAERERRFAAWSAAFDALAEGSASAWIVEDVHWAGADLLAFLAYAVERVDAPPLRVFASARPSILDTAAEWTAAGDVLHLAPLPTVDAGELVRALIGEALPTALVEAIAERSDGNPLFIEELIRTWISVGTLVRSGGAWSLAVEPEDVALPPTVQAVYAAQLDDLPADARFVARRAAVFGRRFPEGALEPLEIEDRSGLDGLRDRAFVDGPEADVLGDSVYAYRHALLRDAGYASLARVERARLHLALAAWMERTAGDGVGAVAESVAEHHVAALESLPSIPARGVPDRPTLAAEAAKWLARAAERALGLAAHERAIELLSRAVALTPADDPLLVAERRLRLGEVTAPVADLDRGIAEMQAALGAFEAHLPASRTGYARAAHALGAAFMQQIRFAEARDLTARALELVGDQDDAATARLLGLHAFARSALGDGDGVREEVERAEAIGADIDDPELALDLMSYRSMVSGEVADVEPADPEQLEAAARQVGRWRTVAGALRMRASRMAADHPRDALSLLDEAAELCRTHSLTEQLGWTHYATSEALFVLGEWDEAIAAGLEAVELAERYAYVRLGFRAWMVLLPMFAARRDPSLMPRFEEWWDEARHHFPSQPSPYGQVLLAATDAWRAAARQDSLPPPPESLTEVMREFDMNPHFLEAVLTLMEAWTRARPPRIEAARAVGHALAADLRPSVALEAATVQLAEALMASAEGDAPAVAAHADLAADAAARAHAPWWELRAIRLLPSEAAVERESLAKRLGITPERPRSR